MKMSLELLRVVRNCNSTVVDISYSLADISSQDRVGVEGFNNLVEFVAPQNFRNGQRVDPGVATLPLLNSCF